MTATLTPSNLRRVVATVALKTGRHPLEVLAVLAANHPELAEVIEDEIAACLTGRAYRRGHRAL